MPNYQFIGLTPRFYPDERDADGRSLMALPGTVYDWDRTPDDGLWVIDDTPPAPAPAPEPDPAPADFPVDPDPQPAAEVPVPPEAAPEVPPAPEPEPAPDPAAAVSDGPPDRA